MIPALFTLLFCQLCGEVLVRALSLPLPGPVAGLVMLFLALCWRGRGDPAGSGTVPHDLGAVSDALLKNLSLLFIPAAVGVVQYLALLRRYLLPVAATIALSTVLALVVTALTFHAVSRLTAARRRGDGVEVAAGAAAAEETRR